MDKIEKIKREYIGRWICIKDEKVVVVSESHRKRYKRLKDKGVSGDYVFYSPREEEKKIRFSFSGEQMRIEENCLVVKAQLWGKTSVQEDTFIDTGAAFTVRA